MQEEVIAKVVEWIQAMGRGEKIVIEDANYCYYIKRTRNRFVVFYERDSFKYESQITVSNLLNLARKHVKKEEKDAAKI